MDRSLDRSSILLGSTKKSENVVLGFFYPSRRLGISSAFLRAYLAKKRVYHQGRVEPLYLITRQRASYLRLDDIQHFVLMIYNASH